MSDKIINSLASKIERGAEEPVEGKEDDRVWLLLPQSGSIAGPAPVESFAPHPAPQEPGGAVAGNPLGYPKAIFFIIGNEFCERFSYYGMKAILPVYLTAWLSFSEDKATSIIHSFNFLCYFFTLFGGILSDTLLGKFKTIVLLSLVYCAGSAVLALTALPSGGGGTDARDQAPSSAGMFIGLLLVAVGTGGIKPCVASFGGDQFDPVRQVRQLASFFALFYFSINAGSVLSMFLTPILRQDVHCFGQDSCYPLAFGLPAALMLVATLVFVGGTSFYRRVETRGNAVLQVIGALLTATGNRVRYALARLFGRGGGPPITITTWYDYARVEGAYGPEFLLQVRQIMQIIKIFSPITVFWALFDQQGSRWTYQAMLMDTCLGTTGMTIKPEQMQLTNAVLILVLIPVFNRLLYPGLAGAGVPLGPLRRMGLGMLLASLSFCLAAALQFAIDRGSSLGPDPLNPNNRVCIVGCVHVLWQLPQYVLITMAEIMTSITGLEFAYAEAPSSLKSFCQAAWLLSVAFGNLLVMLVNELDPVGRLMKRSHPQPQIPRQTPVLTLLTLGLWSPEYINAWNFVLWAGLLLIATGIFALFARRYVYLNESLSLGASSDDSIYIEAMPDFEAGQDNAGGGGGDDKYGEACRQGDEQS